MESINSLVLFFTVSIFFTDSISLLSDSHFRTWLLEKPQLWLYVLWSASNVSAFEYVVEVCHSFCSQEQVSFSFLASVTICSDFGVQENKICHYFHFFPIYLPCSDGTRCHILGIIYHIQFSRLPSLWDDYQDLSSHGYWSLYGKNVGSS